MASLGFDINCQDPVVLIWVKLLSLWSSEEMGSWFISKWNKQWELIKINEITLQFQENSQRQLTHAEILTMKVFCYSTTDFNTV